MGKKMLQIFKRIFNEKIKFNKKQEKEHCVGPYTLLLPSYHSLDTYQKTYQRYDVALGEIALVVFEKYPEGTIIDIGANVGDSAALLSKYKKIPILCIEGNPEFIPFLTENVRRIKNEHIFIERCFIGTSDTVVDQEKIKSQHGTATVIGALGESKKSNSQEFESKSNCVCMASLSEVLSKYHLFLQTKLLKIDTDGCDFSIIQHSLESINKMKPVLFFEYFLDLLYDGELESISAITKLMSIQYKNFIVYDNFGNYLLSTDKIETFIDLNAYLRSNKRYKQVIYYFDVCAFHQNDEDLFETIRQKELNIK